MRPAMWANSLVILILPLGQPVNNFGNAPAPALQRFNVLINGIASTQGGTWDSEAKKVTGARHGNICLKKALSIPLANPISV